MFYQLRTGCPWRRLPHGFPPQGAVWFHLRRWRDDGTLERVQAALRKQVCQQAGKRTTPSALILDSQTVKTRPKGGPGAMMRARRCSGASGISA
ncbi:MAG: transposase [Armatimonadetes bacterium]|nr:transposase [Armatimonadota bacterium]